MEDEFRDKRKLRFKGENQSVRRSAIRYKTENATENHSVTKETNLCYKEEKLIFGGEAAVLLWNNTATKGLY
jgi:hypothetical protein